MCSPFQHLGCGVPFTQAASACPVGVSQSRKIGNDFEKAGGRNEKPIHITSCHAWQFCHVLSIARNQECRGLLSLPLQRFTTLSLQLEYCKKAIEAHSCPGLLLSFSLVSFEVGRKTTAIQMAQTVLTKLKANVCIFVFLLVRINFLSTLTFDSARRKGQSDGGGGFRVRIPAPCLLVIFCVTRYWL